MKPVSFATFLALLFVVNIGFAQNTPSAKEGILDASTYELSSNRPLKLNGEWKFYWNNLIELDTDYPSPTFVDFPHLWEGNRAQGYASYKLTIIVGKQRNDLALSIPTFYSAYTLWANEKLVARNGVVSTAYAESRAQWLPQVVTLNNTPDTLNLLLHVSNFQHSKGGLKDPIYLGISKTLLAEQNSSHIVNIALVGVLTFIGLFFLNIYFFVKREKSVLYFALICICWAMRAIFSEQYLAIYWMPWFDWELAVKIEYITLYLEMAFAILFIAYLYPLDTNVIVKRIFLYPNYVFVFLTMATPALLYTQFLTIYLFMAGGMLIYVVIVIMRAMVYERYGAWFSVLGIFALACAFGYNYLTYQGVFEFYPIAIYSSYLIFFLLLALALAFQLSPKAGDHNYSESLTLDDFMKK